MGQGWVATLATPLSPPESVAVRSVGRGERQLNGRNPRRRFALPGRRTAGLKGSPQILALVVGGVREEATCRVAMVGRDSQPPASSQPPDERPEGIIFEPGDRV